MIAALGVVNHPSNAQDTLYYRSEIGPRPILVDSSRVAIRFQDSIPAADSLLFSRFSGQIAGKVAHHHAPDSFVVCSLLSFDNYFAFLDTLLEDSCVAQINPAYVSPGGSEMSVGSSFIVQFHDWVSLGWIDSVNSANGVTVRDSIRSDPRDVVLRITNSSPADVLEIANEYFDFAETVYSHPIFGTPVSLFSTNYEPLDFYRDYCTHVQRVVGDYASLNTAWDISLGSPAVVVAVIDAGVESHEDIPASRIVPGFDPFVGESAGDGSPCPSCDVNNHGQAVAGLIGAAHSTDISALTDPNSGVISTAPGVSIMPIRIFHDFICSPSGGPCGTSEDTIRIALLWAMDHGATITNNSWGYGDHFLYFDCIAFAFSELEHWGRGGLGIPSICGSGNNTTPFNQVTFPAILTQTIAVGAIGPDDVKYGYSAAGPGFQLDIVAPSGDGTVFPQVDLVWSTDRSGALGYNTGHGAGAICPSEMDNDFDYTCTFGGTSAACPLVTGTAALLLSLDPTLTIYEVNNILRNSADPDMLWGSISPPNVLYGNGKLDALRALLAITRGDANNDGNINIADVTKLICFICGDCDPATRP
ncbi:MAG: S8 family serine peptidase, partial [candidate division Zixibacteria bacterium]|nr:S8 family serine peptidase [candidate division Zixibacteria bacterium]